MSDVPAKLKYTSSHEWVREEGNGVVTVGITEHAQDLLGDLVFVELPESHAAFKATDEVAVVESVKAASDVYAPVDGTITAVNEDLVENPELVNSHPYTGGWLYKMNLSRQDQLADLLTAEQYAEKIAQEA